MNACTVQAFRLRAAATLLAAALLSSCATLPDNLAAMRAPSQMRVAPADAPLAHIASRAGATAELSALRPLPQASFALDARLELLRRARDSIDLQTYHLARDRTGLAVLRELRDAAARGVRVRLLLDDWYNTGVDDMLLGLAAHPNIELRLFNPFVAGRDGSLARYIGMAADFTRLNHRMHNKLLVVDGVVSIAGGRNLSDEYFLRSAQANFIDFEMLIAGPIVPQLGSWFDRYWNGPDTLPITLVPGVEAMAPADLAQRRERFNTLLAIADHPVAGAERDIFGRPPLSREIERGEFRYLLARGGPFADAPDKRSRKTQAEGGTETLNERFLALLSTAKHDVAIVSPYFVPGPDALAVFRTLRDRGVEVRVFTNATATSDEPLVGAFYARYRDNLLRTGLRLFEVSTVRVHADDRLKRLFGRSIGRLHAKLAVIDHELVLIGSMNADPRSARLNTELGVAVRSRELADALEVAYEIRNGTGAYEVRMMEGTRSLEWIGRSADGTVVERLYSAPGLTWWDRVKLTVLSLLVPEAWL